MTAALRVRRNECALVVVDIQERLASAMEHPGALTRAHYCIGMAHLLGFNAPSPGAAREAFEAAVRADPFRTYADHDLARAELALLTASARVR